MKTVVSRALLTSGIALALSTFSAVANLMLGPATVQETGVSPGLIVNISSSGFYTGGAWAGVNHLQITQSGITGSYDAFCIDPFHFSPNQPDATYRITTLNTGGYLPPILSANVATIERLLAYYYHPGLSNADAAALQVAIWETVGGNNFSATGYSDSWYGSYIAAASGALATDQFVVDSDAHQDYVLVKSIPDGGMTSILLGMGMLGLGFVRRMIK